MEFEESIKQWVSKDNQIKNYSEKLKVLRQERSTLTEHIISYAEDNNLSNAVIQITDGKLKFNNSKSSSPLTYKFIEECLVECLGSDEKAKAIVKYIKSQRVTNIKSEIKRYYN